MTNSLQALLDTLPQQGRISWIGIRPGRDEPMIELDRVSILEDAGLEGDRFRGRAGNPRQVTLIQREHLDVIASCLRLDSISPSILRRNLVVEGLNLLALKNKRFRVGGAVLEHTGLCHPCSKMERALGPGGYNAMRGHGGITARVIESGMVGLGDPVNAIG